MGLAEYKKCLCDRWWPKWYQKRSLSVTDGKNNGVNENRKNNEVFMWPHLTYYLPKPTRPNTHSTTSFKYFHFFFLFKIQLFPQILLHWSWIPGRICIFLKGESSSFHSWFISFDFSKLVSVFLPVKPFILDQVHHLFLSIFFILFLASSTNSNFVLQFSWNC